MSTIAKILIVEDDDDLRRGMMLRLRAFGYEVAAAQDGVTAVSVALAENPDLVLLDIGLPGGDGLTVLERYASLPELSALPVIVLTGRDPRATEPEVRRFDVAAFLRKPVENDVLASTIALALRGETIPTAHLPGDRT
ncbi:response regulator [Pengzhenrongella phosphoraccumulans]|uniref:response regulator n=1 Tax=Pengzhenrongella phosphoraccumulans TaxID=3114394 RepID=UPI00388D9982